MGCRARAAAWVLLVLAALAAVAGGAAPAPVVVEEHSTTRVVRNLTITVPDPLQLLVLWTPPLDLDGLSHLVLNLLHVSAEGVGWQYEATLNASTTSVVLPLLELAPLEGAPPLVLTRGMRVATRMRAVYQQAATKILAPRLRAVPAYILIRDIPETPAALAPCPFSNGDASGPCALSAYACTGAATGGQRFVSFEAFNASLASAPRGECGAQCNSSCAEDCIPHAHNRTLHTCCSYGCASNGRCRCALRDLDELDDTCSYGDPFSVTFSYRGPRDQGWGFPAPSGAVVDEMRYELVLYLETANASQLLAASSVSNGAAPTAGYSVVRRVSVNTSDAGPGAAVVVAMGGLQQLQGRRVALAVRAVTSSGWRGPWSNLSSAITVPGVADAPQVHVTSGQGPHDEPGLGFLQLDLRPSSHASYHTYPRLHVVRFDVQVSEAGMAARQPACQLQMNASQFVMLPHNASLFSHRLRFLEIGKTFYIRARAVTEVGAGNWSATVAKTLVVRPSAIRNQTWRGVAPLAVNVSWLPPRLLGCGSSMPCSLAAEEEASSIWYSIATAPLVPGTQAPVLTPASAYSIWTDNTSLVLSNVPKGQRLWVMIRAENTAAQGVSEWSEPLAIISADLPHAPRNLVLARGGSRALRLTWLRPADTGTGDDSYPLHSYQVQLSALNHTLNPIYTSFDVTHELAESEEEAVIGALAVGVPLSARMRSRSSAGSSNWTRWSTPVVPLLMPSPPRNVSVYLEGDQAAKTKPVGSRYVALRLFFSEPAETGRGGEAAEGEPILWYSITTTVSVCQPEASTENKVISPAPLLPLVFRARVGCAYTFQVRAVSALGTGDAAAVGLTAVTSPSPPRVVRLGLPFQKGSFAFSAAWQQPEDVGDGLVPASPHRISPLLRHFLLQVASNESMAPETVVHEAEVAALNYSLPVAAFASAGQALYGRIAAVNDMGRGEFSNTTMLIAHMDAILQPAVRVFAASPSHGSALPQADALPQVLTGQMLTVQVCFCEAPCRCRRPPSVSASAPPCARGCWSPLSSVALAWAGQRGILLPSMPKLPASTPCSSCLSYMS